MSIIKFDEEHKKYLSKYNRSNHYNTGFYDIVPNINKKLLKLITLSNKSANDARNEKYGVFTPSYLNSHKIKTSRLRKALTFFDDAKDTQIYNDLKKISDLNFFYDTVENISYNKNNVYDFYVPENNRFFANGFINHNTVNMRNESTIEDVEKVYWLAYNNGAKGVTVYRDGSKSFQVLNLSDKTKKEKKDLPELSDYYPMQTGQGPIHIHINYNEEGPTKVFANLSPAGTEIAGLVTAIAILLSKYFEYGGDPVRILKHLNSIKSEKPYGFGKNRIDSVSHAISIALRKHLIKTGKIKTLDSIQDDKEQKKLVEENTSSTATYCSQCFSSNIGMVSGCSEPTCFDCGYSKCS